MKNLGRNDPCHCGSGKKYKKCHLQADERRRFAALPSPALADFAVDDDDDDAADADADAPIAHIGIENLSSILRDLHEHGSTESRNELSELRKKTGPLLEYLEHRDEIDDASRELESHQESFRKLVDDEDRFQSLTRSVFVEERFAPLRFTASEVRRAFDQVGYPSTVAPNDQTVATLRAAILHLADKDRRAKLSMSLLLHLPYFVSAGRYLEACLVQVLALQTAETQDESNPFLFFMFSYGFDEWAAANREKSASLLREMGMPPEELKSMNLRDIESWVSAQGADPAKSEAIDAFLRQNPDLREDSAANLQALERGSVKLLTREDGRILYLSFEEVEPWLVRLNDIASQNSHLFAKAAGESSDPQTEPFFQEVLLPILREMADAIFTRERLEQLIADLHQYQSERFTQGDHEPAGYAMGAIAHLNREDDPGQNSFLLSLCWHSLGAAVELAVAKNDET